MHKSKQADKNQDRKQYGKCSVALMTDGPTGPHSDLRAPDGSSKRLKQPFPYFNARGSTWKRPPNVKTSANGICDFCSCDVTADGCPTKCFPNTRRISSAPEETQVFRRWLQPSALRRRESLSITEQLQEWTSNVLSQQQKMSPG